MKDPQVMAALTAGLIGLITSLITVYWIKPFIDKKFHLFKLTEEYKHEQGIKIKQVVGKYKNHLINSAELMNSRIKNYSRNYSQNWLSANGNYSESNHYLDTSVYRFLSFFAYIRLIEEKLEYLDTTNSDSSDLEMIKYFRIFSDIMTDVELFEDDDYDSNEQTDHFFRNRFDQYISTIIEQDRVLSFNEFEDKKDELLPKVLQVFQFFDGMTVAEPRLRLERTKSFHCILIGFLNHFGYDFQQTTPERISTLKENFGGLKFKSGTSAIIQKYKLIESRSNLMLVLTRYHDSVPNK